MEYQYYNPSEDKGSCVARTLTKLTNKPYSVVKAELVDLAKKLGFETQNEAKVFENYMEKHGFFKVKDYKGVKVKNLKLDDGEYCIFSTNNEGFYHLFPIIDNVIWDRHNTNNDLFVISVYKKK